MMWLIVLRRFYGFLQIPLQTSTTKANAKKKTKIIKKTKEKEDEKYEELKSNIIFIPKKEVVVLVCKRRNPIVNNR